jgi:hypothetical protein
VAAEMWRLSGMQSEALQAASPIVRRWFPTNWHHRFRPGVFKQAIWILHRRITHQHLDEDWLRSRIRPLNFWRLTKTRLKFPIPKQIWNYCTPQCPPTKHKNHKTKTPSSTTKIRLQDHSFFHKKHALPQKKTKKKTNPLISNKKETT